VYYTRLTQRLVAALTVPTRRGRLYEVDLRLRPQGGKGPVAVQFRGFLAYQRSEAELWEHMALTRARPITDDEGFGAEVSGAIAGIVAQPRDPAKVTAEVRAMRELVAREKGDQDPWDVKLASGGLTDIDFLAQAITLVHAAAHPSLVGLSSEATIAEAAKHGLLDEQDARVLHEAHVLLNDIFHWQRLTIEGPFDAATVPPAILRRIANAVGRPDSAALLADLREAQSSVREIFVKVLAAA
jgi:glutamate-ammonia-ligase adenylyltransferase